MKSRTGTKSGKQRFHTDQFHGRPSPTNARADASKKRRRSASSSAHFAMRLGSVKARGSSGSGASAKDRCAIRNNRHSWFLAKPCHEHRDLALAVACVSVRLDDGQFGRILRSLSFVPQLRQSHRFSLREEDPADSGYKSLSIPGSAPDRRWTGSWGLQLQGTHLTTGRTGRRIRRLRRHLPNGPLLDAATPQARQPTRADFNLTEMEGASSGPIPPRRLQPPARSHPQKPALPLPLHVFRNHGNRTLRSC